MALVLVVDGSDICRAPIVEYTLRGPFAAAFGEVDVESRGLEADEGAIMCDSAAVRIGNTGPALAFYGAHRAARLTGDDLTDAALVLTAERAQRAAVTRMLPGSQTHVFTGKEALVLATVLADRVRNGIANPPEDVTALAAALHSARGIVPLIEPPVRTGVFHRRRPRAGDPITVESGHTGVALHPFVTRESQEVAEQLGDRVLQLAADRVPRIAPAAAHRRGGLLRRQA